MRGLVNNFDLGLESSVSAGLLASSLELGTLHLDLGHCNTLDGNLLANGESNRVFGLLITDKGGDLHWGSGQLAPLDAGLLLLVKNGVIDRVAARSLVIVGLDGVVLCHLDPELGDSVLSVDGGIELVVEEVVVGTRGSTTLPDGLLGGKSHFLAVATDVDELDGNPLGLEVFLPGDQ